MSPYLAQHCTKEYKTSPFEMALSSFLKTDTEVGAGGGSVLTVSDKAMQTNVNFLMWAAVTVLLVLTSLLLGLF